jgi:acetylornithine/succinyldiaminopimelate/putrescine aminotransferase
VIGDDEGGLGGNYHGTTIITQMMRGMWPELTARLDVAGAIQIRTIRPNSLEDLDAAFAEFEGGFTKIAGLFHEIVMMNYGGLTLTREFLHHAYDRCAKHDVPVVCDEIQSCIWSSEIFLFREYGLKPSFVSAGKGFPGGEYPASRIVFSSAMDVNLPQFGALVTNGQEELASLAYLVTLTWAQANAGVTKAVGDYYAGRLREVADRYEGLVTAVEGHRHMSTLFIEDLESAKAIASLLVEAGLDISAQTYKADCPPALLTKLPLIAGYEVVDCVVDKIDAAMATYTASRAMARGGV